jgi:hypothetical protein
MRLTAKLVAALAALVLTVSLGLVSSTAHAAKPKHDATANPKQAPSGQLYIAGKVSTFKKKTITVQRKDPGGSWTVFAQTKTKKSGKYRVNVSGPSRACFRVVIPKTKKYRKTTITKSPGGIKLCLQ